MTASVLIVEDEAVLRDVYELILSSVGYKIYTARNGVEALEVLKKISPDAMILDIFMPIMNGRDVLKKLNRADHPNLKIVVCSNMADNTIREEVLSNGADLYVLKSSLGPDGIIELINEMTGTGPVKKP